MREIADKAKAGATMPAMGERRAPYARPELHKRDKLAEITSKPVVSGTPPN